ncbi:MAG: HEPN domain-containing protein [Candidatus Cloacimonetes bacterium]|nr:HEPN domain-containing protein [Candidatus Cloacimonadota bacterium]
MKNKKLVKEWLHRAKSNLKIAIDGKTSDEVFYEDLCFNAQQATEKALKALFILNDVSIPKTHNIGFLLESLEKYTDIEVANNIKQSVILTEYAVQSRYPGSYYPVEHDDYMEAIKIAVDVLKWVNKIVEFRFSEKD